MALRKRTHRSRAGAPPPPGSPAALARRDEKILVMLAVQVQQLNDRLTRLEDRFDSSEREYIDLPDQEDLLEMRLHSARLAAELSRVTIELRAEIADIAKAGGEVIDLTVIDEVDPLPAASNEVPQRRVDDLVGDRPDPAPRPPRARRTSGWKPVRSTNPPEGD